MAPVAGSGAAKRRTSHTSKAADSSAPNSNEDTATTSNDATELLNEMPRLIRLICVVTVAIALLAVAAALAFPDAPRSVAWADTLASHRVELSSTKSVLHAPVAPRDGKPAMQVLAVYPHDAEAFTQGLLVAQQGTQKFFIESTGLIGKSSLRKVEIATGKVLVNYPLDDKLFGEGVALSTTGDLVMITWTSKKGLTFGLADGKFTLKDTFAFETTTGEGWGIDNDGTHFVVSDGSSTITFWDPITMKQVRQLTVTWNGQEVSQLNELEFANGYIYANVWFQSVIVKINPADGKVVAVFDCNELVQKSGAASNQNAVLNGIAYDGDEDVFYLTGKLWSQVFKVRLVG